MNKSRRDGVHKRILLVESDERMANPTEEKEKKKLICFVWFLEGMEWQQQQNRKIKWNKKMKNKCLWNVFKTRGIERGESPDGGREEQPRQHSSCGYSDESHRFFIIIILFFVPPLSVRLYYTDSTQGWCSSRGKNIRTCVPTNHDRQGLDLMALWFHPARLHSPFPISPVGFAIVISLFYFHRFFYTTPGHYSVRSTIFMSIMPMDGFWLQLEFISWNEFRTKFEKKLEQKKRILKCRVHCVW